jgi:hypothetical protein
MSCQTCRKKWLRLWRIFLSNFDWISKDYYMDVSNPELFVLKRKEGLHIAWFPPERATRQAILQTIVKDREMKSLMKRNR